MKYWLPTINPDASLGGAPEGGKLVNTSSDKIEVISDNLVVNNNNPKDLRSIPNVWAKALSCQMFLRDMMFAPEKATSYCKRVIGEWRGLLAALVLRKHYKLDMSIGFVRLDDSHEGPFLQAAMSLLPSHTAFEGDSWQRISLLYCNIKVDNQTIKYPIGMTSPTTMVSAAAAQAQSLPISWHKNGSFVDPLTLTAPDERLTNADIIVLAYWLKHAIEILEKRERNRDNDFAAALIWNLRDYYSEICSLYPDYAFYKVPDEDEENPMITFAETIEEPERDPMLSLLFVRYAMNFIGRVPSQLMFEINGSYHIMEHSLSDSNPVVFGIYDYATLKRNPEMVRRAIRDRNAGMHLYRMEDLFLPNLAYMVSLEKDAMPEPLRNRGLTSETPYVDATFKKNVVTTTALFGLVVDDTIVESRAFILPLSELAFNLVEDIRADVSIEIHDEDVVVAARVKLLDGNKVEIKKTYKSDELVRINEKPIAAIWPRYRIPGWEHYYFMSAENETREFHFEPAADSNSVMEQYKKLNEEGHPNTKPYVRYYKCDKYPRALSLKWNDRHAGYLLPAEPEQKAAGQDPKTVVFGIDFGTSSSTIYGNTINEQGELQIPFKVNFMDTLAVLCCDVQAINQLIEFFMTPFEVISPFPTVVHAMKGEGAREPYMDANLFFHKTDPYQGGISYDNSARVGYLKTQVKWTSKVGDQLLSRTVIAQIVMMAVLYARLNGYRKIKWQFSYPLSLNNPNEFMSMCKECVNMFGGADALETTIENAVTLMTESEAVARYFVHSDYVIMLRNITIVDIGGGSSDVFLHLEHGDSMKSLQTSIRYGARNMLLDLLYDNRQFLSDLINRTVNRNQGLMNNYTINQALLDPELVRDKDEFYMHMENLLSVQIGAGKTFGNLLSDYIIANYDTDFGNFGAKLKMFRTIIAFYVSSLFYYCGMLIRFSRKEHADSAINSPFIGIAGNGSNILDWIRTGFYDEQAVSELLRAFMNEGIGSMGEGAVYKAVRSKNPKEEASKGLVSKPFTYEERELESDKIAEVVLAGESFVVSTEEGEQVVDAMTNLAALPEEYWLKQWKYKDLAEIDRFIALFNRQAAANGFYPVELTLGRTGGFISLSRTELLEALNRELASRRMVQGGAQGNQRPQVAFAAAESLFIKAVNTIITWQLLRMWRSMN
ncbi:MAG TPA: hypothetical protein GXZ29_05020 [Clostridiales bacterium]|nr:hypothetical protein [Clostridiales bacterium]